jgi:hypothetical protein
MDKMVGHDFLKEKILEALEHEIETGNVRVMLWLADKLGVVNETTARSERSIADILDGLTPEDLEEYKRLGDVEMFDQEE